MNQTMTDEAMKIALEHDARVPASIKHGLPVTHEQVAAATSSAAGSQLAALARQAACLAVKSVVGALEIAAADPKEDLELEVLEQMVRLAERLDILADKAESTGR